MKAFKTGILVAVAGSAMFAAGGGLARADSSSGTTPNPVVVRSTIGVEGQYCSDISGGQVFVPSGANDAALYCPPNSAPAYISPAPDLAPLATDPGEVPDQFVQ